MSPSAVLLSPKQELLTDWQMVHCARLTGGGFAVFLSDYELGRGDTQEDAWANALECAHDDFNDAVLQTY